MPEMTVTKDEYLYVEKYRPTQIDDLIIDERNKAMIKTWIKDGQIPNILLSSKTPGLGKTSLIHVLAAEIGAEVLFINASLHKNIDMLRDKVMSFAATSSFDGKPKICALDEADFLNANTTQPAMRAVIEEFSKNVRFILTCNDINKIIEPIQNRMIVIDFDEIFHDKTLIKDIYIRAENILKNENIEYTKEDLAFLVKHYFPSSRAIIMKLHQFSTSGTLVVNRDDIDSHGIIQKIINVIISKDFVQLRKDITALHDPSVLFTEIYNNLDTFPKALHAPIVICVAKYQSYDTLVRDRLVNVAAMGAEIMQILK